MSKKKAKRQAKMIDVRAELEACKVELIMEETYGLAELVRETEREARLKSAPVRYELPLKYHCESCERDSKKLDIWGSWSLCPHCGSEDVEEIEKEP